MIKDVLVLLDGSDGDEFRIRHAEVLVGTEAHLTGLFLNPLADLPLMVPIDASAVQLTADVDEEVRRQGDLIAERLAQRFSRLPVPNEIRRFDGVRGDLINRAVSEARSSDLFVGSRPSNDTKPSQWSELFDAILFESGHGIYVVPPARQPPNLIRRIVIAWRDTREAARAVAEAMPLIEMSPRTTVALVDADAGTGKDKYEPGHDVARHLDRHGARVEVTLLASENRAVSDVILDQARRMSADLIVMGAYGHSRAREWVIGGTTVEMLDQSEFPMLMAH